MIHLVILNILTLFSKYKQERKTSRFMIRIFFIMAEHSSVQHVHKFKYFFHMMKKHTEIKLNNTIIFLL